MITLGKPMKIICTIIFLNFIFFSVKSQKKEAYREKGKASFYSNAFEGKRTASGEIFHQNRFTAAHKSLPFGTWVKVVNLRNKRSVIVLINDRGPFVKGRIIDLSKSAAREIGNLNDGIFHVEIYECSKDTSMIPVQKLKSNLVY
jgi:rare lipoprotein A